MLLELTFIASTPIDKMNKQKHSATSDNVELTVSPLMRKSPTSLPHQKLMCIIFSGVD